MTADSASSADRCSIRLATLDDLDSVAGLLLGTWQHYWGEREGDAAASLRAAPDLLGDPAGCRMMLGLVDGRPAGFATFALLYPGPDEHGVLFMKDLFVVEGARSSGLGERLMRHLAALAAARGCQRFDWSTETGNVRAIAFYERLAAARVRDKVYFRFAGDALTAFADPVQDR